MLKPAKENCATKCSEPPKYKCKFERPAEFWFKNWFKFYWSEIHLSSLKRIIDRDSFHSKLDIFIPSLVSTITLPGAVSSQTPLFKQWTNQNMNYEK